MRSMSYSEWETVSWMPRLQGIAEPTGGYVSFGKVDSWFGDIWPSRNLEAALKARSYNKEIILFTFSLPYMHAVPAWNLVFNLRDMGWDHWILLVDEEELCTSFRSSFPYSGCAWSSFKAEFPSYKANGVQKKIHLSWLTAGRAVRLGYNVLVMDADITVHYDLYTLFKTPPLRYVLCQSLCLPTHSSLLTRAAAPTPTKRCCAAPSMPFTSKRMVPGM